jgi:hypothetical protein
MSPKAAREPQTRMILTEIEKLDAIYPNMIATVKGLLDGKTTVSEAPARLKEIFGVDVTVYMVQHFRTTRWVPEKELMACKSATSKAAVEAVGGDAGVDAMVLAKLWETMDRMTIPQLLSARSLFIRVRAQNLKEQEFLFKSGQLKPGGTAGAEAEDPETKTKRVMNKIRGIFGLAPLQDDADDEEQDTECEANEAETGPPANQAAKSDEGPLPEGNTAGAIESQKKWRTEI